MATIKCAMPCDISLKHFIKNASLEVILDVGLPFSIACGTHSHVLEHEN